MLLKYTGLCIVYVPFWHVPLKYMRLCIVYVPYWHMLLMVPLRWRTQRIEDNARLENESRDIEDR